MDPSEVKQELDKQREATHELRGQVQLMALAGQQTNQIVPQLFQKLDSLKDLMHDQSKEVAFLKGDVNASSEKTSAALLLLGVKMEAADKTTDAKIDDHLTAHKKWFPIIPALIVSFIIAVAGAIVALIKKG